MYFKSRVEAGQQLAALLTPKYRYENCAVLALDDGGVMVAAQVAERLHTVLGMLLSEDITLPSETLVLGGLAENGTFSYSSDLSAVDINEYMSEYYGVIEQAKLQKLHHLNELLVGGSLVSKNLLRGQTVILVSDGLIDSMSLDLAVAFLKPIRVERLVVATPMASVKMVDRMHILADEIVCLNVLDSDLPKAHYYDVQDIPDKDTIIKTIERIILNWK